MANSNKTISIGFKIEDGADGLKTLTMDADALRKVLGSAVEESKQLQGHLVNFASVATGIDSLSSSFDSLLAVVNDLAGAYDVQAEVETQLEQVMRNTMDATDEQIQSIKDFCSAQQQIGIIGDEFQLAGAQELATYLEMKSSLQSLIPVMNDMLAQQYGFAATGENAAQIASMLGKVMEGQTGALSRYGYKFDEAQEKILKYGTESERVAVLVEVVRESVGGMNQALAQTPSGQMKQLDNALGDVKEELGAVAKRVQPVLTIGANAVIALGGVVKLIQGIKALNISLQLTKATAGWLALGITAVTSVIAWFYTKTNDAAGSLDRLKSAEERAADEAERLADAEQTIEDARRSAASSIELNIAKLKNFNGTKAEEKKLVKEMNATYGETMGYFKSVASWYQALIKNSKAYCDQMVAEAKARKYADQIAQLEIERDKIAYDEQGNKRLYSTKHEKETKYEARRSTFGHRWTEKVEVDLPSEHDKAQAAVDDYQRQIDYLKGKVSTETSKIKMPVMGDATPPDLDKKGSQEKTRLQEINKLLTKYQEQYVTASETQRQEIKVKVDALMQEKGAIELAQAELERPVKLDSIEAYNKEISYQEKLRNVATSEQIVGIDKTISRLQQEKTAFELVGHTELRTLEDYDKELSRLQSLRQTASIEQLSQIQAAIDLTQKEREAMERSARVKVNAEKITSYKELEEQIQLCNELLRYGTDEEKRWATENLPLLQRKEKAMSAAIAGVGIAERPEDASNLEEIGAAISLLDDKIQRASADEVDALTRTRMEFEKKKKAYERGIEIPAMQKEVADIMKLPDAVMKVKIESMGFDELSTKIRDIQNQLDDLNNPPTEGQRKALEELKATYEDWRRECVMSFNTIEKGWSSVKSIGNGVDNLSKALQENKDAWSILTTFIDSFIEVYNGITSVIAIIETLSTVSQGNTVAKTAEATATAAATTATVTDAAAAETAAVAQLPVIAANKLATASYLELAAAQYMAAHASIPFAGFGIGAAFAQGAQTLVQSIGAMPFADGGVVYGPTLGLVGEYAGARSNPEVIAPLNKLKDIIGDTPANTPVIIGGRIELSGRTLTLLLENQSRITGLSGKRRY